MTKEGPKAVQEAINFLKKQSPVGRLAWDANLAKAAKDHADDSNKRGIVGHTGSDGSTMSARI